MTSMTNTVPASAAAGADRRAVTGAAWFVGLCLALAAVCAAFSATAPAVIPFALALGPMFIALGLAWREGNGAVRRLRHSIVARPPSRRWYLVIGLPILFMLTTVAVAVALGAPTAGLWDKLTPAALFIPLVVVLPAFAEELGWRAYLLPRATTVMSPLQASLVLAIPWVFMHLVLQLPGGVNEAAAVWPTIVSLFAYSVILTWIFVRTGGSALMTALVHTGLNGFVPLVWGLDPNDSWAIRAIVGAGIAVAIVALGGFRNVPAATRDAK